MGQRAKTFLIGASGAATVLLVFCAGYLVGLESARGETIAVDVTGKLGVEHAGALQLNHEWRAQELWLHHDGAIDRGR